MTQQIHGLPPIPEGWELLPAGEPFSKDYLVWSGDKWRPLISTQSKLIDYEVYIRPIPNYSPIAPGHNPSNLTVAQVGEGYRVLEKRELVKDAEVWRDGTGPWMKSSAIGSKAGHLIYTHRVPITPTKRPLIQEDWQGGVWWIDTGSHTYYLVVLLDNLGLRTAAWSASYKYLMEKNYQRSRDLINWEPCYKS